MIDTHMTNNYMDWIPVKDGETMLVLSETMDNLKGMWDFIVVSDAFARVPAKFSGKDCYAQFFQKLKAHLNPGGKVYLAVDNRYGLQYFAGCRERLTGKYFEGLEGYPNSEGVCTFSKASVLEMVKSAGFSQVRTYYPYPNYRYMTALYTDEHLPSQGDLNINFCNFEEERVVLFHEGKVFDELIKEGKFQEFSNSYLFELQLEPAKEEEKVLFMKYSVERREEYRIRTEIVQKADGTKVVRKVPYGTAAIPHVQAMKHWEQVLRTFYEPAGIRINRCTLTKQGAEFEFLRGRMLEDVLDEYLEKGDYAGFLNVIKAYEKKLETALQPVPFVAQEAFRKVFGDMIFDTPQTAAKINNIDLIFSNIILTDEIWNVIDYEWTFDFAIPLKFIVHRAITLYCLQRKQKSLQEKEICFALGISEGECEKFLEMEHRLQRYLLGDTKTMAALQQEYAGKVIELSQILQKAHEPEMKIYPDNGAGFSEASAYSLEADEDFYGRRRFSLSVQPDLTAVRIDPCEQPCMVTINRIMGECGGSYELSYGHNGKAYDKSILFTTNDPQLLITGLVPGTSEIHLDLTVEYLKEETSYLWMKLLSKAEKCDRLENSKPYRWMKKIKRLIKKG